ncbi:P-type conjugative transfer protein TrbL, partial [Acidithiobacillus ferridurans]|nr:P-type conjugative transfer protein TrbL [Acidithiobacillus ferridurans]
MKRWLVFLVMMLIPVSAYAATSYHFGLMTPFENDGQKWFSVVQPLARDLWVALFGIEIAWFAAKRVLFKVDIHSLIPALVKTLLFAGFGLAFIIHGANWFHAIVQSFVDVGQKAANIPPVTPATIIGDGLDVATQLITSASKIDNNLMGMIHPGVIGDLVGNPGLLIIIGLFAILIVLAFVIVAAEFIAIQVLGFIMFGVGVIMLGFSAFRPVASFAEKYFSAAISIGARLMVLYVIIGIGMGLAATWPSEVAANPTFFTLLMVLGQATVFGYLAVRIPSLAAGLLQGSLNTGGG